jgi:hypothetical protein
VAPRGAETAFMLITTWFWAFRGPNWCLIKIQNRRQDCSVPALASMDGKGSVAQLLRPSTRELSVLCRSMYLLMQVVCDHACL